MGMYTELHYNARLKRDVPPDVLLLLRSMCGEEGIALPSLPAHPLFTAERWKWMLCCDSAYFSAETHSEVHRDEIGKRYVLCVRCNLKNYSEEIEHFVDWIGPYIDERPGNFLGFERYEETEIPTLIYAPSTLVRIVTTDPELPA